MLRVFVASLRAGTGALRACLALGSADRCVRCVQPVRWLYKASSFAEAVVSLVILCSCFLRYDHKE